MMKTRSFFGQAFIGGCAQAFGKAKRALVPSALAMLGLLAGARPSQAQSTQTIKKSMTFTTTDQSIWKDGVEPAYNAFLGPSWNKSFDFAVTKNPYRGLSGILSGKTGLDFSAAVMGGKVNVTYPIELSLTLPANGTLQPGDTFTISSKFVSGAASLTTTAPLTAAKLDFKFTAKNQLRLAAQKSKDSDSYYFISFLDLNPPDVNTTIFDTNRSTDTKVVQGIVKAFNANPLTSGFASLTLDPEWAQSGGILQAGTNTINAQSEKQLLGLNIKLTDMAIKLGGGGGGISIEKSGDYTVAGGLIKTFEWKMGDEIANLSENVGITGRQNFTFTAKPTVVVTFGGRVVTMNVGESKTLTFPNAPAGSTSNEVPLSAQVFFGNQFQNVTDAAFVHRFGYNQFRVYANSKLLGINVIDYDLDPIGTLGLHGTEEPVWKYDKSFSLGGFSSPDSTIAPVKIAGYVYPKPELTRCSPGALKGNDSGRDIDVYGQNFAPGRNGIAGSTLLWDGRKLQTSFVSDTQLRASVPGDLLPSTGRANGIHLLNVSNPAPNPGNSGTVPIIVDAATPDITLSASTSLLPATGLNVPVTFIGTMRDQVSGVVPNSANYRVEDRDTDGVGQIYEGKGAQGPVSPTADGSFSFTVDLPAKLMGDYPEDPNPGTRVRVYTIRVSCSDAAGNQGVKTCQVAVAPTAVTVLADRKSVAEDAGVGLGFWVNRVNAADISAPLIVNYSVTGTAVTGTGSNDDYSCADADSSIKRAIIPAGETGMHVTFSIYDDKRIENDATLVFTLKNGSGYYVDPAFATATGVILDDDLEFSPAAGVGGSEGDPGSVVTLKGMNFGQMARVRFNGKDVLKKDCVLDSDTQLRLYVPDGAKTGKISVIYNSSTSSATRQSAGDFVVFHKPVATVKLSPDAPTLNGAVTATATKSDADGDQVSLRFGWSINGQFKTVREKGTGSTSGDLSDRLDLTQYGLKFGDVVSVSVWPNDGTADGSVATTSVTLANHAPVAVFLGAGSELNLQPNAPFELFGNDTDGDSLTYTIVTAPAKGTMAQRGRAALSTGSTGQVGDAFDIYYTPGSTFTGFDSFTFKVNDGMVDSPPVTVSITSTPINKVPSFTKGADVKTTDAGAYSAAWASAIKPGPASEAAQKLDFIVSNDKPALFSVQPSISSTGTLSFTPAVPAVGTATVTVKLHDDAGTANGGADTSAAQTFTITLSHANRLPVATEQGVTTSEESPITITLAGADADGDPLTYSIVTKPTGGTLGALNGNKVTYTPDANYNGTTSFTFNVNDGKANSAAAKVSITVTPVNDAPSFIKGPDVNATNAAIYNSTWAAALNRGAANENAQKLDFIVSNDKPVLFSVQPAVSPTGTLSFAPAASAVGTASLTVKLHDDGGTANGGVDTSAPQTFTITLTQANRAPVATEQSATVNEDSPTTITLAGTDADGDALTYSIVTKPAYGTLGAVTGNKVTYTPDPNYNGTTSFTFKVSDGKATSTVAAKVSLTVTPVNDAPSFIEGPDVNATDAEAYSMNWAEALNRGPANENAQKLDFIVSTDKPELFSVQPAISSTGTLSFTPAIPASGTATVTVKLHDDGGAANGGVDTSAAQTFTITLTHANHTPVPTAQDATTNEDTVLNGQLAGTDVDGDALSYAKVANPANGSVVVNADGTFTYTPKADFNGTDSFSFKVNDGTAFSTAAKVSITINPVNDAPVASDGATTLAEDSAGTTIDLSALVSDKETPTANLTYSVVTAPSADQGTLTGTGATRTFVPAPDFNGIASFTYKVTDSGDPAGTLGNALSSDVQTVTFAVSEVNDAPTTVADTKSTDQDDALTFAGSTLTVNDSGGPANEAGQTLTVATVNATADTHGTVRLIDGQITYRPDAGFFGAASFSYTITDNGTTNGAADAKTATGTVNVAVNRVVVAPVNHKPSATLTVSPANPKVGTLLTATATKADEDAGDTVNLTFIWKRNGAVLKTTVTTELSDTLNLNTVEFASHKGDFITVTVTPNDGKEDGASACDTLTVANTAPEVRDVTFTGKVGTAFIGQLAARDADAETLTFKLLEGQTLPDGLVLDGAAGTITGTPTATANGTMIQFKANDGTSDSNIGTATFTIESGTVEPPVNSPLVVNTTEDVVDDTDGLTSLREAVAYANSNEDASVISFDPTVFATAKTITLGSGLTLEHDVTITGSTTGVTVTGTDSFNIITVSEGVVAEMKGLTISHGFYGGVINRGTVTLTNCTLSDNFSGINNFDNATLINCTLSGGVFGLNSTGTVTLASCTITGNATGFYNNGGATMANTLVVGNTDANLLELMPVIYGPDNIVTGTAEDAGLDPAGLADNGGPTKTIALMAGSPAIDAGDDTSVAGFDTDQRGTGYARISGDHVDIGAFEVQSGAASLKFNPSKKTF